MVDTVAVVRLPAGRRARPPPRSGQAVRAGAAPYRSRSGRGDRRAQLPARLPARGSGRQGDRDRSRFADALRREQAGPSSAVSRVRLAADGNRAARRDTAMSRVVLRVAQIVGVLVLAGLAIGVVLGLVQWLIGVAVLVAVPVGAWWLYHRISARNANAVRGSTPPKAVTSGDRRAE